MYIISYRRKTKKGCQQLTTLSCMTIQKSLLFVKFFGEGTISIGNFDEIHSWRNIADRNFPAESISISWNISGFNLSAQHIADGIMNFSGFACAFNRKRSACRIRINYKWTGIVVWIHSGCSGNIYIIHIQIILIVGRNFPAQKQIIVWCIRCQTDCFKPPVIWTRNKCDGGKRRSDGSKNLFIIFL
mgnify:CR=1 FL=1